MSDGQWKFLLAFLHYISGENRPNYFIFLSFSIFSCIDRIFSNLSPISQLP